MNGSESSKKSYRKSKYPEGEIKRLVEEFGYDDSDLARHFETSIAGVRRARVRACVYLRGPRGVAAINKPGARERVESLLDEGYSYNAIFGMTGIQSSEIRRAFPGRGFTMEQRVEAMVMARRANEVYRELGAA